MISDKDRGIQLDVGRGESKQDGFLCLDGRDLPGVDIIHNVEALPYPISDSECHVILLRYVIERIKPWLTIDFFNEMWRIMKPGGKLVIATPYAGNPVFWQDPGNCNGFTEHTFQFFDPACPVYKKYTPKPWKVAKGFPMWQDAGNMEVVLIKFTEEMLRGENGKEQDS